MCIVVCGMVSLWYVQVIYFVQGAVRVVVSKLFPSSKFHGFVSLFVMDFWQGKSMASVCEFLTSVFNRVLFL